MSGFYQRYLSDNQFDWLADGYADGYWTVADGGTGIDTYTTGDLLYASTTNTLNKLPAGSTNDILTVTAGIPSWKADNRWIDINRNGFVDNTLTTIAFDDTTYIFTLGAAGSWKYMRAGIEYTVSGSKSIRILPSGAPVDGSTYFITINGNDGTLTVGTSVWDLDVAYLPVAIVHWKSTLTPKYLLEDERHTCAFDRKNHKYLHETRGTQYITGGNLTGFTPDSNTDAANTFQINQAVIADEDLYQTLAQVNDGQGLVATNYTIMKRITASTWEWVYSDMPFSYTAAGYINWDNGGTLTQGTGGTGGSVRYYNTYLLFTNGQADSRFIIIPGQNQFTSTTAAYAETFASFTLTGLPILEWVAMYQMTWMTGASGLTNKGKCKLTRAPQRIITSAVTAAATTGVVHNGLSGLQGGTTSEYYHLTANQNNWVADGYNNGLWRTGYSGALTPASTSTITVSNLKVMPGLPIRIFDTGSPIIYGDTNSNITSVIITDCVSGHCDSRGMLYFSIIDDTGGYFHVDAYDDAFRTHKVFHTATFNSIGSKNIIADAVSTRGGLAFAGTITIAGTIVANTAIIYQFYKYYLCTAYNGTTLSLAGIPLSMVASSIKEIYIGSNNLVVEIDCNIPAAYGSTTLNTGFETYRLEKRYWNKGPGHLVMLQGASMINDTGATQPKIALYNGGIATIAAGSELAMNTILNRTVVEIVPTTARIEWGANLDLRIVRGQVGDASSLYAQAIVVLEDK